MKLFDQIIVVYECLGEFVEGLIYLNSIVCGLYCQVVLECYVNLVECVGKDDQVYDIYVCLQKEFGFNVQYVFKLVNILYVCGQFVQVFVVMQVVDKVVMLFDDFYWWIFVQFVCLNQCDDLLCEVY